MPQLPHPSPPVGGGTHGSESVLASKFPALSTEALVYKFDFGQDIGIHHKVATTTETVTCNYSCFTCADLGIALHCRPFDRA